MSSRNGFTLIELLIAASLIAVAAFLVASAFAAGFRVWQRASQLGGAYADAVVALELFQKDVRNTVPSRLVQFAGGQDWVEIPSIIRVVVRDHDQDQPGAIRYDLGAGSSSLERITRSFPFPDPGRVSHEDMVPSVDEVRFSYADRGVGNQGALMWVTAWAGRTNMPCAVKMTLRIRQGGERFDFERTVPLPCR